MTRIRVLLVDDHAVLRNGLSSLLREDGEIEVVGQAADGLEAVQKARELGPDVVVMDIAMPLLDGVAATERITRAQPGTRVVILSQHEQADRVVHAVRAGARGYLFKRTAGSELAEAIRAVWAGGAVFHPSAARALLDAYLACAGSSRDPYAELTEREREVLVLVAKGHTNREIADLLSLSVKTVDGHRTRMMAKLDLHDRTEVVRYAARRLLIDL